MAVPRALFGFRRTLRHPRGRHRPGRDALILRR